MLNQHYNQLSPQLQQHHRLKHQLQALKILTYINIKHQTTINKTNRVYHHSRLFSVMINRMRSHNIAMEILQTINKKTMVYL